MANIQLTQELVKYLFDYHQDGYLIWKTKTSHKSRIIIGSRAGSLNFSNKSGYRYVTTIFRYEYKIARIIFLWHHGYLPDLVDHDNRNPLDDRIENLRAATKAQNGCNRNSAIGSSSKYLGVSYSKQEKKWVSSIRVNKKLIRLGCFNSQENAAIAYNREAVRYHKEFANLNIITPMRTRL